MNLPADQPLRLPDGSTWDGPQAYKLACQLPAGVLDHVLAHTGLDSPPCKDWKGPFESMLATGELFATWLTVWHGDAESALGRAASVGKPAAVVALLDRGAQIDAFENEPLMLAATNGHADVVRVLLDRGEDVHARGDRALWLAARHNRLEVARLLIARGGDVNAVNCALRIACRHGHLNVVRLLLEGGANANDDEHGCMALCCTIDARPPGYEATEIVRLLLDHGADLHASDEAPLGVSVRKAHIEVVRLLLDRGANMNVLTFCPVGWAVGFKNVELLRVLLQRGQPPVPESALRKALDLATGNHRQEMIALLRHALL